MPEARIILGSVFAPPDAQVTRLLVTGRWPRGVVRGAVDQWEPRLGPAPDLAEARAAGTLDVARFAEAYRAQLLARPSLLDWAARMATNNGVALLCDEHDAHDEHDEHGAHDEACHGALLAALLRERIG